MMIFEEIRAMSSADINKRLRELSDILESGCDSDTWSDAYIEYNDCATILDERYREENQSAFDAFYEKHIKGRSWDEIDPEAWQCYSDWHKDMYGFRPKPI